MAATSLAQVISGQFPRWLGWPGLVVGVFGIASSAFLSAIGQNVVGGIIPPRLVDVRLLDLDGRNRRGALPTNLRPPFVAARVGLTPSTISAARWWTGRLAAPGLVLDAVSEICLKQSRIADQICRFSPYWLRVVGFGAVARRLVAKPHAAWAHVSQPTVRLAASPVVAGV